MADANFTGLCWTRSIPLMKSCVADHTLGCFSMMSHRSDKHDFSLSMGLSTSETEHENALNNRHQTRFKPYPYYCTCFNGSPSVVTISCSMMHVCPVGSAATQVGSWLGRTEEDGLDSLRVLETWWYSLQKGNINT